LTETDFNANRVFTIRTNQGLGGAVFCASTNSLVINRATFTQNKAGESAPGGITIEVPTAPEGGAIYCSPGPMAVTNSVFALNLVEPSAFSSPARPGAGAVSCADAIFDSCDFVSNRTEVIFSGQPKTRGVGGIFSRTGAVALHSVILADFYTNIEATIIDLGFNLSSDDSPHFIQATSRANVDLRIGEFQLLDGYRGYFQLSSESPAINSADRKNFPQSDLFGMPRPMGAGPDIGAIEKQSLPIISIEGIGIDLEITVRPVPGNDTAVEVSEDLVGWEPVMHSAASEFKFLIHAESRHRFYRVRPVGAGPSL
jgi:hypothetical protein